MSLPKIIDNERRSLFELIDTISTQYDTLNIATGYRDLPGTALLIDRFSHYKKIRLLIGREPLINRYQLDKPEADFPGKDIFDDLESMWFKPEYKATIEKIKALKESWVLEVKIYMTNFLHAKCYIFGDYDSDQAIGIIGSSNFTKAWLTSNTELNALESDHRTVLFQPQTQSQEVGHLYRFDTFWNHEWSLDWTGKFTALLEQSAHGDLFFSPYEMYIKVLYELYKEEMEEWVLEWNHHEWIYQMATFQEKNVQLLKRKLKKYKTALLCDSVGLGKTIQWIGIIKEYLYDREGKKERICVICPKSLEPQRIQDLWDSWLNPKSIEIITLQNPQKIQESMDIDKRAWVKLFVIDESHNLRKSSGSRYNQLLDWISNNPWAHVLMLTATPINNEITDLVNQILLGTRGESSIIKVNDENFVRVIEKLKKKINKQKKLEQDIDFEEVRQIISPILRSVVVRRTRDGIIKEYGWVEINGELKQFPISFPDQCTYKFDNNISSKLLWQQSDYLDLKQLYRLDPEQYVELCTDLKHPLRQLDKITNEVSLEELLDSPLFFTFQLVLSLWFIPYRWRIYQKKYYGKSIEQIKALKLPTEENRKLQQQRGIYGIFRTIFLKRLESSIAGFEISLASYEKKLKFFADGVHNNKIVSVKGEADKLKLFTDDDDIEEIQTDMEDIHEEFITDLWYEKEIMLEDIQIELDIIRLLKEHIVLLKEHDPKLEALRILITKLRTENINGGKVLLFSYFADTIEYLKKTIGQETTLFGGQNIWFVSSANRSEADVLSKRFSPISKRYDGHESPIQYLFATDVLSEWQNLQDCGVVINYDLHRNPVRMIQRNGRINRLWSQRLKVYIYNMHPATKIESYLKLVNRLENKIAVINATIGNDQSVLWEAANPIEFMDTVADLYSPDEQKRIRAMEQIEQDADLLAVDDQFISDLKVFDNNPEYSAEYKQTIYQIPQHKRWQYQPTIHTDEKLYLPDYIVLGKLLDEHSTMIDLRAYGVYRGDSKPLWLFEFLNLIRMSADQNTRQKDILTINKTEIAAQASIVKNYLTQEWNNKFTTMQKNVVDQMIEYAFDFDDIDTVKKSLFTSNYLHQKKLEKLLRSCNSIIKQKGNPVPSLHELVWYARRVVSDISDEVKPSSAQWYLYFVIKS